MAKGKSNFIVRGGADFSSIKKSFDKLQRDMKKSFSGLAKTGKVARTAFVGIGSATKKLSTGMSGLSKIAIAAGAAFAAIQIKNYIKDAQNLYSETVQNEQKLATVMKANMGATDQAIQGMLDFMGEQQKLGVVSARAMTAGAQELATYIDNVDALKMTIPTLNNIATQQYGINVTAEQLAGTATMLGKVMCGQLGGLSRWGYSWTEAEEEILKTGTAMEKAAVISRVVKNSVGDMNYALAQTDVGRQKQLANTFSDIRTQAGAAANQIAIIFLPALQAVAQWLGKIANLARQVAQLMANAFGRKAADNQQAIADTAQSAAVAENKMGAAIKKTQAIIKKTLTPFDELYKLQNDIADSSEDAADAMLGMSDGLFTGGIQAKVEIDPQVSKKFDKIKKSLEPLLEMIGRLKEAFSSGDIGLILSTFGETIGVGLQTIFQLIYDFITSFDWIHLGKSVADGIMGIFKSLNPELVGGTIAEFFNSVVNIIYGFVSGIDWAFLGEWLGTAINSLFTDFDWAKLGKTISDFVLGIVSLISNFIKTVDWRKVGESIGTAIRNIDWGKLALDVIKLLGEAIKGAFNLLGGVLGGLLGGGKKNNSKSSKSRNGEQYPGLATGAVLPPNKPFAAIVGDQKHGMNIETPVSLMRETFEESQSPVIDLLDEILGAIQQGQVMIVDKKVLGRIMKNELADQFSGAGISTIRA